MLKSYRNALNSLLPSSSSLICCQHILRVWVSDFNAYFMNSKHSNVNVYTVSDDWRQHHTCLSCISYTPNTSWNTKLPTSTEKQKKEKQIANIYYTMKQIIMKWITEQTTHRLWLLFKFTTWQWHFCAYSFCILFHTIQTKFCLCLVEIVAHITIYIYILLRWWQDVSNK